VHYTVVTENVMRTANLIQLQLLGIVNSVDTGRTDVFTIRFAANVVPICKWVCLRSILGKRQTGPLGSAFCITLAGIRLENFTAVGDNSKPTRRKFGNRVAGLLSTK
jgi:hypothetical protein